MTTSYENWSDPISLGVLTIPPFPKDVYPLTVDAFVTELSQSTETPLDLAGTLVLAGIATASHKAFFVQVKPDYKEPTCIWVAPSLISGSRKSAVISAIMKPIVKFELDKQEELKPIIAEQLSKNESLKVRLKEMRQKAAKAPPEGFKAYQADILEAENELDEVINIPQLWAGDVTPENLATLMMANEGCMALLSDEAGIFDTLSGRYSNGIPNLDLFLKAYSGSAARVNRTGRPPDLLPQAILTIGITPQPDILMSIIGKNAVFRGRGLLGRFLYALPASNLGDRKLNAPSISKKVEMAYEELVRAILTHSSATNQPYMLTISETAQEVWRLHSLVIELQMAPGGQLAQMTDWGGKLPGQTIRIAALIHIAHYAHHRPWELEISKDDMKAAISISNYFMRHAIAVFDLIGADPNLDGAKTVLQWIKTKKSESLSFTFRDCQYDNKNRFKKAKDLELCLEILVSNYYIQELTTEKKTGRPSRIFEINPLTFEEAK